MKKIILFTITSIMVVNYSYAYKLNPLNRSYSEEQKNHFAKNISESVHEKITVKALESYQKKCLERNIDSKSCLSNLNNVSFKYNPIIRGNWWSDDPNQMLYKAKHAAWLTQMQDAERRAKNKTEINDKYKMLYRTHFGDMQFMHSMASKDGESPYVTKKNILMWTEFLYKISTGELDRNSKFKDININELNQFFNRHKNWEIQWILQPNYRLKRQDDFKLHALGALLHTVQDSYSASHTERIFNINSSCTNGKINKFLSYTNQNKDNHTLADNHSSYNNSLIQSNNPLKASEQLIEFSMQKADWTTTVEPYLSNVVFCLNNPEPSSAGRF